MPAITTNDLKTGITLQLDNGLFQVVEFQHVKPGKGGAFVRTKLRNVRTGSVLERTFNAGIRVEQAIVDRQDMQFLYRDGDDYVFMNTSTYDQLHVPPAALGDGRRLPRRAGRRPDRPVPGADHRRRDPGVGRADRRPDRARRAGRPGVRRPQAGRAGDRQDGPGPAVRRESATASRSTPAPATTSPASESSTVSERRPKRPDRRSDARERALYLLYEAQAKDISPVDALERPDRRARRADGDCSCAASPSTGERLDAAIAARATGWSLARMPVLDLNVLRLGAFELAERADVPGRRRDRRGRRAGQAVLDRQQRPLRQRRAVGARRRPAPGRRCTRGRTGRVLASRPSDAHGSPTGRRRSSTPPSRRRRRSERRR